jgi:hypothetical protein
MQKADSEERFLDSFKSRMSRGILHLSQSRRRTFGMLEKISQKVAAQVKNSQDPSPLENAESPNLL